VAEDYRRRRCGWNAAPCANLPATPAGRSWPPAYTPPGSRHPASDISPAQYERLLLEPDLTTPVGVRDRAILRLLGDVGLRPSEVCALKFEDMIWRADGQVPVQLQVAWGKGRIVPLTPQATATLAGWLPHHPDWQPDERGRELSVEAPLFVTLGSPKPARQAIIETGLLRQVLAVRAAGRDPCASVLPLCAASLLGDPAGRPWDHAGELQVRGGWRDRRSAQA
jgi:integrase